MSDKNTVNNVVNDIVNKKIKKKKTPRCNLKECKKKLKLTDSCCPACNLKYCDKHRYFSDHNCSKMKEYYQKQKDNLNNQLDNSKVINDKIKNI